jgi:hypothetical protein
VTAHNRKLKIITLDIGGTEFQVQLKEWTLNNNTDDGETFYTFGGDDEAFVETPDGDFTLDCTFYSDWRSGGISDYLWENDGEQVAFQLDHHPDVAAEHVRWTGDLSIKAPTVGGEARVTEETPVTFRIVGTPTYARV